MLRMEIETLLIFTIKLLRENNTIIFMHGVFDRNGVWEIEEEDIEKEVVSYFDTIFTSFEPFADSLEKFCSMFEPK